MTTKTADPVDPFQRLYDAEREASIVCYWAKTDLPGPCQVRDLTVDLHAKTNRRYPLLRTAEDLVAERNARRAAMRRRARSSTTVLLYQEVLLRLTDAFGPTIARAQLDALIAVIPDTRHRADTSWLGSKTTIRVLTRDSGRHHLPDDFACVQLPDGTEHRSFVYTEDNFGPHAGLVPHYNEDGWSVDAGVRTFGDLLDDALDGPKTRVWLTGIRDQLD